MFLLFGTHCRFLGQFVLNVFEQFQGCSLVVVYFVYGLSAVSPRSIHWLLTMLLVDDLVGYHRGVEPLGTGSALSGNPKTSVHAGSPVNRSVFSSKHPHEVLRRAAFVIIVPNHSDLLDQGLTWNQSIGRTRFFFPYVLYVSLDLRDAKLKFLQDLLAYLRLRNSIEQNSGATQLLNLPVKREAEPSLASHVLVCVLRRDNQEVFE